ncbi:MAG: nicotinate-nucleotide adenylyltransferase [Verrucomicrobiota bacterium]|nr:nicotinate-nucleotide adenylyltransferase [Verrucomicrobiota bacterium]
MKRIGIYGGTFDPVHHAHLILARDALEKFELEKIIFVPAAVSPFREAPSASADIRWQILQTAIAGEPCFEANDCELRRPPPSYTIDTVLELGAQHSDAEFFFLIGDDNLPALPRWHRYMELRELVTFVVLARATEPSAHDYLRVERRLEISATEIRARVAAGRSIRYLVPEEVEKIIRAHKLYRETSR